MKNSYYCIFKGRYTQNLCTTMVVHMQLHSEYTTWGGLQRANL